MEKVKLFLKCNTQTYETVYDFIAFFIYIHFDFLKCNASPSNMKI